MNTVSPESTTAALAKDVPFEKKEDLLPGTFPVTPAAASEQEKEFKIDPLPATEGAINPIKLAPGEKIPDALKSNGTYDQVTLDKESYEKSDRIPGLETELLPPVSGAMIPESSLPLVASWSGINSAAPDSSTAALAAAVPLEEPKVPDVVKESQEKANVAPEASGISEEVAQKAELEDELAEKVPEAPSTSEGTAGKGTEKSETDKTIGETVAAAGLAALATATTAKDALAEKASGATTQATATVTDAAAILPDSVKQALPVSVQEAIPHTTKEDVREEVSPEVPAEVKESITEAERSPEAAANTEAVGEKKDVETELLKEVKRVEPIAEPSTTKEEAPKQAATKEPVTVVHVPKTDEPAAGTTTKAEGSTIEEALRNGPQPETTQPAVTAPAVVTESGIIQPEVNGAKSAAATAPETPVKAAAAAPAGTTAGSSRPADSPATAERKKKNRLSSIFSKIKHKVSGKDKP